MTAWEWIKWGGVTLSFLMAAGVLIRSLSKLWSVISIRTRRWPGRLAADAGEDLAGIDLSNPKAKVMYWSGFSPDEIRAALKGAESGADV